MTEGPTLDPDDSGRAPLGVLVALVLAVLGGLVIVGVAAALETTDDCTPDGYGGYNCVDYDDAEAVVEPSTDLVDRQIVTVSGTDFDPHFATVGVAQCDAALVESLQVDACDLSAYILTSTDGTGAFSVDLRVRRIITTAAGGEIDCAVTGACVIGAGTFRDLTAPIEGTVVPISFDPAVPPVPRLTVEVTLDEVDTRRASGTVVCNRAAEAEIVWLEARQERPAGTAYAYGYRYGDLRCDVTPTEWVVQLRPGDLRLVGGPASVDVWATAWDDGEWAEDRLSEIVRLRGGSAMSLPPIEVPGRETTIELLGATGRGEDQRIEVEVVCNRAATDAYVYVDVSQWAGRDPVRAYGFVDLGGCDGAETVEVPLEAASGVLVGGPATVEASVSVESYEPGEPWYFDNASTTGVVRLRGQAAAVPFDPEPDPGSRIVIDEVTRSHIRGTVHCDTPVMVDLSGGGVQQRGRALDWASGYDLLDCDGTTPFELDIASFDDGLRGGPAAVGVYGWGYRLVTTPEGYVYYEFAWEDEQQASVRVAGPGS